MYLGWFPGCVNFRGQFDSQVQSVSRRTFTVQSQCLQSYKCVLWKNNTLHETANIQDLMCPYARTLKLTLYVLADYKSVRPQFETICMVSKKNCFSQYYVVRARAWIGVIFGGKHDSRSLFLRWVETVVEAVKLSNVNIFIILQSGESLSAINKKKIIALTFLVEKSKIKLPVVSIFGEQTKKKTKL